MSARFDNFDVRELVKFSIYSERGNYWADANLGSDLHALRQGKLDASTSAAVERTLRQATQWLIDDGIASAIEVTATRAGRERVVWRVEVARPKGTRELIEEIWAWR